ncbi:hypothetical protein ACO1O0_009011 [Amphichorda felina]
MHFSATVLALLGSAALVSAANKVTFRTLDDAKRTIYFTANDNEHSLDPVEVDNSEETTVEFPDEFVGNFYAVEKGKENKPGMLGEVKFSGKYGKTYFDVSAIVDPNDKNGVKQMWPAKSKTPMSGCEEFPCDNAYYLPDDVQTKVTEETHIITTLGKGSAGLD